MTSKVTSVTSTTDITETVDSTYNLQGRLETVTTTPYTGGVADDPVEITEYTYNPDGIRTAKHTWTETNGTGNGDDVYTDYLIDPYNHTGHAQVLEETIDGTNLTRIQYTIGDDVISQTESTYDSGWSASDTEYLLYDGHGSTRQLANSSGTVIDGQNYSYDGYGVMLSDDSAASGADVAAAADTTMLYAGEQYDSSASMYYNRARYYNPSNGLFNRVDPYSGNTSDPQSLHKYAYCHNNPINGIDPSGMWSLAGTIAVTGIVSSIVGGILLGVGMKIKNDVVRDIGIAFLTMGLALIGAAALMAGGILLLSAAEAVATALGVFGATLLITIAGGIVSEYADRTITTGKFKRFLEFYAIDSSRKIPPKGILIFREGHGNITEVEIPNFVFSVKPQYMTNDTVYAYECTNPDSATNFVIKKYKIDSDGKLNEKYTMERSMQGLAKVDKNLPVGWTAIE